jgi:hypothetical protein
MTKLQIVARKMEFVITFQKGMISTNLPVTAETRTNEIKS